MPTGDGEDVRGCEGACGWVRSAAARDGGGFRYHSPSRAHINSTGSPQTTRAAGRPEPPGARPRRPMQAPPGDRANRRPAPPTGPAGDAARKCSARDPTRRAARADAGRQHAQPPRSAGAGVAPASPRPPATGSARPSSRCRRRPPAKSSHHRRDQTRVRSRTGVHRPVGRVSPAPVPAPRTLTPASTCSWSRAGRWRFPAFRSTYLLEVEFEIETLLEMRGAFSSISAL